MKRTRHAETRIEVRLAESDAEFVRQMAQRRGLTVSAMVRAILLDRIERERENLPKIWLESKPDLLIGDVDKSPSTSKRPR